MALRWALPVAAVILAGCVVIAEVLYRGPSELRPILLALAVAVILLAAERLYHPDWQRSKDAADNARAARAEAGYPQTDLRRN